MIRRVFCLCAVSLLLLPVTGCGESSLANVSGKVTYDGEPVEAGEIRFVSTDQSKSKLDEQMTSGGKIVDGAYSISDEKGVPVGTCRVEIWARRKTGVLLPSVPPAPVGSTIEETISYIPREYNTASTLTEEIKAGSNEINFDLKKIE